MQRNRIVVMSISSIVLAVIAVAWMFATGAAPDREPPSWMTERPFAHRGLHDSPQHPENSLAAFEAALNAEVPMELDVQLSSDGTVVVIHDEDLERMTGDPRLVAEVTYAEMVDLRIEGSDEHIPSLAEVLELVDGRQAVLVEIKNPGDVGALEDAVAAELADYSGDVAVISFNPYSLQQVAQSAPDIARGQLTGAFVGEDLPGWQKFALSNLLMNWASEPDFIAMELEMLPNFGSSLQQWRGRPVLAWTAESAEDYERAMDIVDNVICDPDGLP